MSDSDASETSVQDGKVDLTLVTRVRSIATEWGKLDDEHRVIDEPAIEDGDDKGVE